MLDRIENRPDAPAAKGRGPLSTKDGESFNQFKNRALDATRAALADHEPGEKTAVVTHYRNIRAIQAWLNAGAKANNDIDVNTMKAKGDSEPGDMFYMHPGGKALLKVDKADQPGVYLIRHGATAWNEGTDEPKSGSAS
jgi:broad specificity phosphatase PhoE